MVLIAGNGGGTTTTAVKSTTSGTTSVSGYSVSSGSTVTTDISQSGSGTTEVSGSVVNNVSITAGTFTVRPTSTILRSVGALSIMRHQSFALLDSFAAAVIDPMWAQVAGNGTITQSGDVLSLAFTAAVEAVFGVSGASNGSHPRVAAEIPFNSWTCITHIKEVTLTTPAAGWVAGGIINCNQGAVGSDAVGANYTAVRRTSAGANEVIAGNISSDVPNVLANVDIGSQTTNIWLMLKGLGDVGDNSSAYYRLTAPTSDDDAFTLLYGALTGAETIHLRLFCAESQDSSGAMTTKFERFDVYPSLGPG